MLRAMETFKAAWDDKCDRARSYKLDVYPQPDDVRIDYLEGKLIWNSAWLDDEAAKYEKVRSARDGTLDSVRTLAAKYRKERDPVRRAGWLDMWRKEEGYFHVFNAKLLPEHRKTMPNALRRKLEIATTKLADRQLAAAAA